MNLKCLWSFVLLLVPALGEAKVTYPIPRVSEQPQIDGSLGVSEWKDAYQVELKYETNPGDSIPAPVKTTAYMMEDGEHIYFAFKAHDPDPEKILAYIRDRDRIFQDDFVGVILDTFNDERRGFEFFVNPMGSQGDLTRDDTLHNEDSSWDAVWDSAGQVVDDGYIVEMAIPFRALRFPSDAETQTWGIQLLRIYPRDSRAVLADAKSNRELDCSLCQANKMTGMPRLKASGANFDVTPTLTYVNNEQRDLDSTREWTADDETELGIDFRWSMTEDWVLNATLNPDFSQVEADAGQLDINTTFSLYYPEARPFFVEGADYFRSMNRIVHTRNIADPDAGIKVTGKTNGYTVGAIASTDTRTGFLIPSSLGSYLEVLEDQDTEQDISSDVFIVRGQSDFGDQNNVGVILTHRSATNYQNDVVAIDGRYYFTKKDILSYQLMYSDSENPDYIRFDGEDDPNTEEDEREELFAANQSDTAYTLSYRHNEENYSFRANYNNFGKDFRADLGFIGQVDYEKLIIGGDYFWYGKEGSKWTRWGFFGDWDITKDQSGKKLEEESEIHFSIRGPLQFQTNFGVVDRERFFDEQYFDEQNFMMWFQFKPWSNFTFGNFMRIGDQVDFTHSQLGEMTLFEPYIRWEIGKHFNVRVSVTSQALDVDGGELFNASVADVRMAYQFSNRSRLSLTLQSFDIDRNTALYESNQDDDDENDVYSISKRFGTQLIYSYKINPQSLVYLGYSDSAREDDDIQSLTKNDKTIFAKVSYMWQH